MRRFHVVLFCAMLSFLFALLPLPVPAGTEIHHPETDPPGVTEDVYTLAETVVSTSKAKKDIFYVPQHVSLITLKEIERQIPSSTPDLFNRLSGVLVQKTNWGGGSVFIRGLTGKHILLLVDGVRLNNSLYRSGPHQYLNTLDWNMIDRIEVVRGPMSVLFGSDALGGTVNIITKQREDFSQDVAGDVMAFGEYGSAATAVTGRLQLSGNVKRYGALMGATYRGFDHLTGGRGRGRPDSHGI